VAAVNDVQLISTFFKKLALLALTGFLAVMLIGPVVAVLGVLISFAAIGLLIWLPIRIFILGKPVDWGQVRQASRKYGGPVVAGCNRIGGGILARAEAFCRRVNAVVRFVGAIFLETCCGAVVGGLLGLLRGSHASFPWESVIWGLGIGAFVGALVALSSRLGSVARVGPDEVVHA
jgi:hypothetical protein